jgi:hypothetical protein
MGRINAPGDGDNVWLGSIVLKKSKMPLQKNSRKSELIADFD